jgi:hypothetical protein
MVAHRIFAQEPQLVRRLGAPEFLARLKKRGTVRSGSPPSAARLL